ncbi:sensor histidine kinase [Brumimicrobium aurantiacum]|uniref:histidine kinase n=1 Tax=Brumimicrobium aurantiacum TaxID=1737063 RepID=A0A3E1F2E6_9FLAO|nr:PAS domain-containing protein [Brumimicrobium aurantiacum]RFC55887.1 PAS domain S-box protein [Brumimicrobium aurantiacum]
MKRYNSVEDLRLLSESALESSLAGFWDWNMETNEEYLSPRFKEMFGYSETEMENKPEAWQKIAFKEDLPDMYASLDRHIASKGKIPFNITIRYHHKNGSIIWVRCNGKVVKWSDDGKPLRAIGCHVDITEEKKLEFQLKKAIKERDILLKEVHHRVKNNLQLIQSLSRLKNKNGKIDTHEIENSISSIAQAYEAIYKTVDFDVVSIHSYIQKVVTPIIDGQKVDFSIEPIEYKQNIDFLIPIGLIITELVNNSMKHGRSDDHLMKISISIKKDENFLYITYCDDGVGYQEDLNEIRESDSFGIAIIDGLIEQLNGTIELFNDPGACTKLIIDVNKSID